jgi:hypothetical protein
MSRRPMVARFFSTFHPSLAQTNAKTFLGADLSANDALTVHVTAGSLVIYGATTDNRTQDPSVQFGRK